MDIRGIGKDVSDDYVDGSTARLHTFLGRIAQAGFEIAELGLPGLDVVINGQLFQPQASRIKAILNEYPLRYTAHAPNRTNLAFGAHPEMEKSVLKACIAFCGEIGARTLVYHSGLQALDAARTGLVSLPDDEAMARGTEREVNALREIAPYAADLGVTIAMENGDPHLWEYGVLGANNKSPDELPRYHGRLRVSQIVAQLEAVDHPAVGMCLDLAHLHLATHALGDDYLAAISEAAPWVRHLHANDNFGKLDVGFAAEKDRLPYGEADLHLPPGWAAIPFAEAFGRLRGYEGDLILEIKDRYWDHFDEALANTRKLVSEIPA